MNKNHLIRRIMALILAVFMIFGTGQYSTVRADDNTVIIPTDENGNVAADAEEGDPVEYRGEEDFVVQSLQDDTTEEDVEQENVPATEEIHEDITEASSEEVTEVHEPEEVTAEAANEETAKPAIGAEEVSTEAAEEIHNEEKKDAEEDTPYRLLVGTDKADIFRKEDRIISEYNGIYLLGFLSEEDRAEALSYYEKAADFVECDDEIMSIADETEEDTEKGKGDQL